MYYGMYQYQGTPYEVLKVGSLWCLLAMHVFFYLKRGNCYLTFFCECFRHAQAVYVDVNKLSYNNEQRVP